MNLRLLPKLAIGINLVLLIFMALFAYINLQSLKKLLLEEAVTYADKLGDTVIRATQHQMLFDDRGRTQEIIEEIGRQTGIVNIRLMDKTGTIICSTQRREIGTLLDKKDEACNMCHATGHPAIHASSMNRSRQFTRHDGTQLLGLAKAIYNDEKCSTASCHFHPQGTKVLGVLDVTIPLDHMNAQLATYRGTTIATVFLLMGLISLFLTIFIQRLVNQPVQQLLLHTEKLARGEMDESVTLASGDELGDLAKSFNRMTVKLKQARDELEDWAKNLETKVEERTKKITAMQAQLVRSDRLASIGELVAGIAHELNNPLTGILVFSSMVNDNPKLDPELKDDLKTIVQETERCGKIVKGLLDFSRESLPQKRPSSINDIMDLALSLVEHQILFQNITIIKDYAWNLPHIMLDPNQFEQVFINMLLNAGQSMGEGGSLHVRTGITEDGLGEFMAISDTGCGIPAENLEKIFDPFFSTKENRGTGLGLSVSYGIIRNHRGEICVQSEIGSGTTFTIRVPIKEDDTVDVAWGGDKSGKNGLLV
ncbi:ATP-binding protein [Geotalea sp. SG265]|uniref:ATP-binding protein n=1 Tax=Geotalea sp. SG265 TaxID=2922867 RepID=UPI001FAEC0A9|nr:ATP-binding protein [Geotalea sp. SG265]